MDIIIKTGFQNISHTIMFQPETVPKGKALVEAGHVRDVTETHQHNSNFKVIAANVIRQTSVTLTPYTTKLLINLKREVLQVSCTCVYNKSGKCKHVAAVIYYINHVESISKTDHEQAWGQISARKFAQEQYSKGKYFFEMFPPPKEYIIIEPQKVELSELKLLKGNSALKMILTAAEECKNEVVMKNSIKKKLDEAKNKLRTENCEACIEQMFMFLMDHPLYTSNYVLSENEKQFYLNNIVIDRKNIVQLCCDTVEQSNCE